MICEEQDWVSVMAYEKLLNEIYAAVSLKYLWPEYRPSFVKCESPDWINETMDFGLEVSQALMPDDGQAGSFIDKYLGCLKEEIPQTAVERYGDRLHFYNGRFWAVLPENGVEQDYLAKAKFRFNKKLVKLNTNYQNRRYNGLYLFLHPTEDDEIDVQQLYDYMKEQQTTERVPFDYVFLNCVDTIYICNYVKDVLETIVLPQNAADFLNAEAENLRGLEGWEDDQRSMRI